jgi:hypothetical protein
MADVLLVRTQAREYTHPTRRRTWSPSAPEPVAHMPTPMSVSVSNRRYPKTFDRRLGGRLWKAHPSRQAPLPQAASRLRTRAARRPGQSVGRARLARARASSTPFVKVYVEAVAPAFGKSHSRLTSPARSMAVFFLKARFACGTRRRYSPRIAFAIAALGPRIIWCAWPRTFARLPRRPRRRTFSSCIAVCAELARAPTGRSRGAAHDCHLYSLTTAELHWYAGASHLQVRCACQLAERHDFLQLGLSDNRCASTYRSQVPAHTAASSQVRSGWRARHRRLHSESASEAEYRRAVRVRLRNRRGRSHCAVRGD